MSDRVCGYCRRQSPALANQARLYCCWACFSAARKQYYLLRYLAVKGDPEQYEKRLQKAREWNRKYRKSRAKTGGRTTIRLNGGCGTITKPKRRRGSERLSHKAANELTGIKRIRDRERRERLAGVVPMRPGVRLGPVVPEAWEARLGAALDDLIRHWRALERQQREIDKDKHKQRIAAQRREIIALRALGHMPLEIGRRVHCTRGVVMGHLWRSGLIGRGRLKNLRPRTLTEEGVTA